MSFKSGHSGAGSSISSGSHGSSERIPTTYTIPDPNSVEEHGRSFTAYREGKYYLPNDGDEQDRLDLQHRVWELAMKGHLYWAPIGKPKQVLDIGTGTGIWAIHFARQHPQATVTGTDLSLIQPPTAPVNCNFVREDCEEPWIFPQKFDFVHLRAMCTCFDDPRGVMQKAYDNLEPGGWIEYDDGALNLVAAEPASEEYVRNSPLARFLYLMRRGLLNATGRDLEVARQYKRWMTDIGFVDVVERPLFFPCNGWPLEPEDRLIGQFVRLDMEGILKSSVKLMLKAGLTQEELPAFLEEVKYSMGDRKVRGYYDVYVVYGRKPDWPSRTMAAQGLKQEEQEYKPQYQTPLQ